MLFPLHALVDDAGLVAKLGRTALAVLGPDVLGRAFCDVFRVVKPRGISGEDAFRQAVGRKLVLEALAADGRSIQFRAVTTPIATTDRSMLVDMSFGTNLNEAMERFALSGSDFKPNDFSIDLFYTFETQRALLEDSQKLADALNTAKEEAEHKAYIDSMTGIANRRALHERLNELLQKTGADDVYALFHIDLDKFKSVNDTFGHNAGDAILKHTAQVLSEHAGSRDLPVRIGGDEFAFLLSGDFDGTALCARGDALIRDISRPVRVGFNTCVVGASVGIVTFRAGDPLTSDRLLLNSDIALYESKLAGNTATLLTVEMASRHERDASLIAAIKDGLDQSQFEPYFQPQVDALSGDIIGLEVVARWQTQSGRIELPSRFLSAANRANLMGDVDKQVRGKALASFAKWCAQGHGFGKLSLNVSVSNLRSPDFIEELQDELLAVGLSPERIQLELLESILFEQADTFLTGQCKALKNAGFSLALDDFGTGYASISTLIDAPISTLKIDRSFVTGLDQNNRKRRITLAMLAMAGQIGLNVLAEGVETRAELDVLVGGGCRAFQGFYFGAPMCAADFQLWLEHWRADPDRIVAT